MRQAGRIAADGDGRLHLERGRVDDRDLVGVAVCREDAARPYVEADVDRLRACRDLRDHLVRLEVDDGDEVASRAGDEGAPARVVDDDSLGIEADRDLGHLPPGRPRVDAARSPDREGRVLSLGCVARASIPAPARKAMANRRPLGSVGMARQLL